MSEMDMPPERDPDADLEPADRLVLHILRSNGGTLRLDELRSLSGLPKRTVRRAGERLEANGHIDRRKLPTDPRRYRWVLQAGQ